MDAWEERERERERESPRKTQPLLQTLYHLKTWLFPSVSYTYFLILPIKSPSTLA
jgi:hypothetical protein